MSVVAVFTAGCAVAQRQAGVRAAFCVAGALLVAAQLAACSGAVDTVTQQSQLMPLVSPASVAMPEQIEVPMPVPVRPPPVASAPLVERRSASVKIGKPYEVAGNWYYPAPGGGYDEEGIASWYGPDFDGKPTANGETYNMNRLSAAHPTLPMPCYVSVTNTYNGRSIVVRINDRGPYKAGRIIDLSHRAAQLLGVTRSGTANVRVRYLRMAPLLADERFEQQFLARQPWYRGGQMASGGLPGSATGALNLGNAMTVAASQRLRPATGTAVWQPDITADQ